MADDLFEGDPIAPAMNAENIRRMKGKGFGGTGATLEDFRELLEWGANRGIRVRPEGIAPGIEPVAAGPVAAEPVIAEPPVGGLAPRTRAPPGAVAPVAKDPGAFPDERPYGMAPLVWNKMKRQRKIAEREKATQHSPTMLRIFAEAGKGPPTTSGPSGGLPAGGPLANHSTPGFTARYSRYKKIMPQEQAYVQASVDALNYVAEATGGQPISLANAFTLFNNAKGERRQTVADQLRTTAASTSKEENEIKTLNANFKVALEPAYTLLEPLAEERFVDYDEGGVIRTTQPDRVAGLKQAMTQILIGELYGMWHRKGKQHDTQNTLVDAPVLIRLYDIMDQLKSKGAPVPLIDRIPGY